MLPAQHHVSPVPQVPSCARPKLSTLQTSSPFILGSLAGVGLSESHFTDEGVEGLAGQDEMRQGLLSGRKLEMLMGPHSSTCGTAQNSMDSQSITRSGLYRPPTPA